MTRLFLARHGESVVNVRQHATDDLENNPLTPLGRQQAADLAESLLGCGASLVYASPVERARETGQIIADRLGLAREIEWGLEEIRVGANEGQIGAAAVERSIADFRRWLVDEDLEHGHEDGENGDDVVARASAALRRIVDRHPDDVIVVVSHGATLALTVPALCSNLAHRAIHERQLTNCALVEVEVTGDQWRCVRWIGEEPETFATSVA